MSGIVKPREEVEAFLQQFMPKFEVWGVIFLNREKNQEALAMLGLNDRIRREIIRTVEACDYVETVQDALWAGDLWVFGKNFDGKELYIKIAMGHPANRTICISFHEAAHPMNYAFKVKEQ